MAETTPQHMNPPKIPPMIRIMLTGRLGGLGGVAITGGKDGPIFIQYGRNLVVMRRKD
jgi:hypothetical protein